MATISSRTELTTLDDNNDVFVLDDVSAVVTKKVKVATILGKTQDGSVIYAADSGANDTYAVTLSPVPSAYTTGMVVNFKANTANTGAATLNVNSLGAKTIKKNKDQDLSDNDIKSGQIVTVVYDGTNFQMQSQLANSGVTTGGTETITGAKDFTGNSTHAGNETFSGSTLFTGNTIAKLFAPQGFLINGKISPSVSGNNLTVAIKTLAGADPSATDPIYVRIGDTVRSITSALSVTANAATNWFNAGSSAIATYEQDYFVYLGYNTTDGVVLGFSRIPGATQYGDFSTTSTNDRYCRISTITNAASTDYYEVVGRFSATLSAGAGYTWSVPTYTAANLIQRPIYNGRFTNYLPSGPTGATLYGRFQISGNMVDCIIRGDATGAMNWTNMPSLPITVGSGTIAASSDAAAIGVGGYLDSGTVNNVDGLTPTLAAGSTTVRVVGSDTSSIVTATSPITWANTDTFFLHFTYEI